MPDARKLGKNDLALTAKFDCDRFLRFRVATDAERAGVVLKEEIGRAHV